MCLSLADEILPFVCPLLSQSIPWKGTKHFVLFAFVGPCFPLLLCLLFKKYSFGGANAVNLNWYEMCMNLCAEVGGKVSMAFTMQGLRRGRFAPSMLSGCPASCPIWRPLYALVEDLSLLVIAPPPTTYYYRRWNVTCFCQKHPVFVMFFIFSITISPLLIVSFFLEALLLE